MIQGIERERRALIDRSFFGDLEKQDQATVEMILRGDQLVTGNMAAALSKDIDAHKIDSIVED